MGDTRVADRSDAASIGVPLVEPEPVSVPVAASMRRFTTRAAEELDVATFRLSRRVALLSRVGDIRHHSRIRLQVWAPPDEVLTRLRNGPTRIEPDRGGRARLVVTGRFERGPGGGFRAPATLHIPWSWPALPVWVRVEPWWRHHTAVSLSLRSTRRLRYPRRYWASAHRTLRAMVGAPGPSSRTIEPDHDDPPRPAPREAAS